MDAIPKRVSYRTHFGAPIGSSASRMNPGPWTGDVVEGSHDRHRECRIVAEAVL